MAKMKIFEMKNYINEKTSKSYESKDIQDFLEKNYGVKKTHSSGLEEHEVNAIKKHFISSKSEVSATRVPAESVRRTASDHMNAKSIHSIRASEANMAYAENVSETTKKTSSSQRTTSQGRNQKDKTVQTNKATRTGNQDRMNQGQQDQQGINQAVRTTEEDVNRNGLGQRMGGQSGMGQTQPGQQGQHSTNNQNSNRPDQQRTGYQGNRPNNGEGGQRTGGYQGNRPNNGEGGQRTGYQGNRPYNNGEGGQRTGGYQGNRPNNGEGGQRTGGYQGNRPYNNGEGGQRTGGYQGNRPNNGEGGGRTGGYQGNRPNNGEGGGRTGGYQGNRPSTGGYQGNRPNNNAGRPGGYQGGGYQNRGYDSGFNKDKDEDDKPSYGNRSGGGRRTGTAGKAGERKTFDQQILDKKVAEKNDFSNKRNRDRMNKEKNYKEKNSSGRGIDDEIIKSKLLPRKGQFIQPKPVVVVEEEIKTIVIPEVLTIKELADKMKKPSAMIIKKLFLEGKMVSLNHEITFEEAEEIALEYDIIAEKEVKVNEVEELLKEEEEDEALMNKRPPVVCVMGHVDHGKTSLLDAIRTTSVTAKEAGGITQHIGAYQVEIKGENITFLDTPGHEAFTSMRMRGAKSTDIAILVVAADDGVMPQTVEAINHAKAAGVQIIVAINKIDKPSANIERVKQELTEYELVAEDWGGDTIFVPVSAHTKEGINQLLEMVLLTAEILELKANPDRLARGLVIEAELDKGRGPVATILVQKGTLRVGDNVAIGSSYGKVRAMMDDKGRRVKEAKPSTPVEILGLNVVPEAGEVMMATANEKEARTISEAFISQSKEKLLADTKAKLSLDGLFSQIKAGNIKELNLIVKADVQGSVEAMKQSLLKLSNDEVAVRIIHGGVGAINESDVILASASNAIIIGFNVKPDNAAKETADREKVDVKLYRVIYNAINDIEAAMKGMLDPIFEEKVLAHAEVRQTFKASGIGTIAGSYVLDGKVVRGSKVRIRREGTLIFEGNLQSVRRFQDDVKEVAAGYECGLVFEKFNDVKELDIVEVYTMVEVPR